MILQAKKKKEEEKQQREENYRISTNTAVFH